MKLTLAILLLAGTVGAQGLTESTPQTRCNLDGHGACLIVPDKPKPLQVGHCYEVTAKDTLEEIACPQPQIGPTRTFSGDGHFQWQNNEMLKCTGTGDTMVCTMPPLQITPFDVPPKEWDGPDEEVVDSCSPTSGTCSGVAIRHKVHHRTCEDKSRFLLMSEDNRWHCISFSGGKP